MNAYLEKLKCHSTNGGLLVEVVVRVSSGKGKLFHENLAFHSLAKNTKNKIHKNFAKKRSNYRGKCKNNAKKINRRNY